MTQAKREIERKYEGGGDGLPELTGAGPVAEVRDGGVAELDATYYDTADGRLAAARITLRRRTGGPDAGWHLKFPVAPGVRDEIRAPFPDAASRGRAGTDADPDAVPEEIAALVRARVRNAPLVPVVRLLSTRDVWHLADAGGTPLAEASTDTVAAERLDGGGTAAWTETEVELADGADPAVLDAVEERLTAAGLTPSEWESKQARALHETGGRGARSGTPGEPVTSGDHVLAYLRAQREAILAHDPAVRRDLPDAVHQMRVATRRARAAFRSFRDVLDPAVTAPVAAELKWLAGELGLDRDQEVLAARLTAALYALPADLVAGPVADRLTHWAGTRHGSTRGHLIGVLDSARTRALYDSLDALLDAPPLLERAVRKPKKTLARALHADFAKLDALVTTALELPPGDKRDLTLHAARKKAKRTRYSAEAAVPALGAPARAAVKAAKSLTTLLGEHQDAVMTRHALRELAAAAHGAGESAFTYGLLYGREERRAERAEEKLPGRWRGAGKRFPF